MNLTDHQQTVYNHSYRNMLSQPTVMEKRYGKNWKQIIHNISINTAKKQAPIHTSDKSGDGGCPCCN